MFSRNDFQLRTNYNFYTLYTLANKLGLHFSSFSLNKEPLMFSLSSEQKGFTLHRLCCVIHISYNLEGEKNVFANFLHAANSVL